MKTGLSMILIAVLLLTSGCGGATPNSKIEEFARDSIATQSEQNRVVAQQSERVAEAAQQLVEAEAKARQEVIELHREVIERDAESRAEFQQLEHEFQEGVRQERRQLDAQRNSVEQERRHLSAARQREPLIANAISTTGLLLACLLPLALAAYALFVVSRRTEDDAAVGELLVSDLTSDHSVFLPPTNASTRIESRHDGTELPRLPGDVSEDELPF